MLKKEFIVLFFALKDNRTGWLPKLVTLVAILYLLSPVDIIPDFIPVLGYLDDLVIVPLLINLAIYLLPKPVLEESMLKAGRQQKKINPDNGSGRFADRMFVSGIGLAILA